MIQKKDYMAGLWSLGIPLEESRVIRSRLISGRLPTEILDSIVLGESEILKIHPYTYPWDSSVLDVIAQGLKDHDIDVHAVGGYSASYVMEKYRREIHKTRVDIEWPAGVIAHLCEMYALLKYLKIDRSKREAHF